MSIARLMQMASAAGVVGDTSWDLSAAEFTGTPVNFLVVAAQEPSPQDIFFKPDGTKMYVVGDFGDDVNEYDLSTAWDVSTASYLQNFSVSAQTTTPAAIFFKSDGTKMYVVNNGFAIVIEYGLSTAWDVSTASHVQNFNVAPQEVSPTGIFFKSDGTKMYVVGDFGVNVNEYDLSTAWDVSTASYLQNFSVSTQEPLPTDISFKSDGTKMYILGAAGDDVNEYNLSTAWDVSTASYVQNFSVSAQETNPRGLFFKPDGTKMYVVGGQSTAAWAYGLSTAWDVSSASWTAPTSDYFSVAAQEINPSGIFFKPDGTKMYVVGSTGDDVNEYNLSTAWDVSTASYVQNFSVSAQESNPRDVFFKPDGTKMYIVGSTGDDVNEYNLSTAWDVSTASYLQNFSVSAQETNPQGIFFKPDGTKMYIVGAAGDDVNEYNLSTAWDVSTASYLQNFSVATEDTFPSGVFFKPDGTKMYVVGDAGNDVNEYDLSTAWDISTASYFQNFSVAAQESIPQGIFFKPDGTKMYVIGSSRDAVWAYDLYSTVTPAAPSWTDPDLANASYDSVSFSVAGQDTVPMGVFFKPDGTKLYVTGEGSDSVYEYDVGTAWDVSSASYSQTFSVSGQDSSPQGLFFHPDGTTMYVVGITNDSIYEYALSTAWDISTASLSNTLNVSTEDTAPRGLFFSADGSRLYVAGDAGNDINQYSLSTAWDTSTASYVQNFSVSSQDANIQDVFLNPDGTKMFVIGLQNDAVYQYSLSTAFDLSTASYDSVSFSVASQDGAPTALTFKSDGSKMYVLGITNDTIYQYSTD